MSHVGTPFSPFFCFPAAVRPERERNRGGGGGGGGGEGGGGGGGGAIRLRPVCLDSG